MKLIIWIYKSCFFSFFLNEILPKHLGIIHDRHDRMMVPQALSACSGHQYLLQCTVYVYSHAPKLEKSQSHLCKISHVMTVGNATVLHSSFFNHFSNTFLFTSLDLSFSKLFICHLNNTCCCQFSLSFFFFFLSSYSKRSCDWTSLWMFLFINLWCLWVLKDHKHPKENKIHASMEKNLFSFYLFLLCPLHSVKLQ